VSASRLVVAVDVGSTSARAAVFDAEGQRLGRGECGFATRRQQPDHAEHRSEEIWRAVADAVRAAVNAAAADPVHVVGLAFDATCSLALFDAEGRPATVSSTGADEWNVLMWADHRAVAEAEEITLTRHRALDYVGGVMSPEMELPKLLWLKRNLPQAWARYALALDLTDFLSWRATGRLAVSACTVTCKWAYLNHESPGWQADLLARVGLEDLPARARLCAAALPIGSAAGTLSRAAASELGLTEVCVVGVGLIDAHAGGLALLGGFQGAELDRRVGMIAGTSTCHMALSAEPRFVPGVWGPYFGAMLPGLWLNEAGQSASGALLDHFLVWHAEGRASGGLEQARRRVSERVQALIQEHGVEAAGGLRVLPDFHGNRSPLADPAARGAIEGLSLDASFESLARLYYAGAVGIALGTRHILEALNAHGYDISVLHLTGGHQAIPWLVQLYADATGCRVALAQQADGVLLGTAILAAAASGLHGSLLGSARAMSSVRAEIAPAEATRGHFEREYQRYRLMQDHAVAMRGLNERP